MSEMNRRTFLSLAAGAGAMALGAETLGAEIPPVKGSKNLQFKAGGYPRSIAISGPAKSGKSLLALDLLACATGGIPFGLLRGPALYCSDNTPKSVNDRFQRILPARTGVSVDEMDYKLLPVFFGTPPSGAERSIDRFLTAITRDGIKFVVFDFSFEPFRPIDVLSGLLDRGVSFAYTAKLFAVENSYADTKVQITKCRGCDSEKLHRFIEVQHRDELDEYAIGNFNNETLLFDVEDQWTSGGLHVGSH